MSRLTEFHKVPATPVPGWVTVFGRNYSQACACGEEESRMSELHVGIDLKTESESIVSIRVMTNKRHLACCPHIGPTCVNLLYLFTC